MTTRKWLAECHAWLDDPTSVQFQNAEGIWFTSCEQGWSPISHPTLPWRIKPATIMLNGTELPKPVPCANEPLHRITIDGGTLSFFYWHTREDRDAVYSKLVEVLGS